MNGPGKIVSSCWPLAALLAGCLVDEVVVGPATDAAPCTDAGCHCPGSQVACDGICADLSADPAHCGSCDQPCGTLEACVTGTCECALGTLDCGEGCVDLSADPLHCGGCDAPCAATQRCDGGACACRPGLESCPGGCVDLGSDPGNCGGCGLPCDGVEGEICWSGECSVTTCEDLGATATVCDGEVEGEVCLPTLSLATDPLHCGDCGTACPADGLCVAGQCRTYSPATGCTTCPCDLCGEAACCAYPGTSDILCIASVQQCP